MRVAIVFDSTFKATPEEYEAIYDEVTSPSYELEADPEYQVAHALRSRGHKVWLVGAHDDPTRVTQFLREHRVDMVWNAAEGFGAGGDSLDFLLPAMLEAEGQPYTGASPQCLMITRNKAMTKKVLAHHNVCVPRFLVYRRGEKLRKGDDLFFPAIVKPLRLDASEGISKASIVHNREAMEERIHFVHDKLRDAAIVEEFIDGRELYVSVLGNGDNLEILPTVELVFDPDRTRPEDRIATKMAKWDDPYRDKFGIRQVFARPISRIARASIERTCRVAFRALWLRDYARFDLRLDAQDRVWVLEANANPYVCEHHEIANAAKKAGIDYASLIERIVKSAAKRARRERKAA
jgi:D-alanine-D-alanine ligase